MATATLKRSHLNVEIADKLGQAADLLEQQNANPFRVRAYRRAADTVAGLERGADEIIAREGVEGLTALPGIGASIAAAIHEMVRSGRWSQLDRLRGTLDPEKLFRTVPGVGPVLAHRMHEALHVDTLEGLEAAAFDGRLIAVPGMGRRRVALIRAALAGMLGRTGRLRRRSPLAPAREPSIEVLLDVDREYREGAAAGLLPTIAPRRFNPEGKAWLPILHASREDWHFTALFSNTALAHELGRTHDWVVVYFYDGDHREGQRTVVKETAGPLAGRRVVRGREGDCRAFYEKASKD